MVVPASGSSARPAFDPPPRGAPREEGGGAMGSNGNDRQHQPPLANAVVAHQQFPAKSEAVNSVNEDVFAGEGGNLRSTSEAVSNEEWEILVTNARLVSYLSIFFCAIFAVMSFVIAYTDFAVALFGLGCEFLLDGISSILVIWRFKPGKTRLLPSEDAAAQHEAARTARRERNASFAIGVTFIFGAALLLVSGGACLR